MEVMSRNVIERRDVVEVKDVTSRPCRVAPRAWGQPAGDPCVISTWKPCWIPRWISQAAWWACNGRRWRGVGARLEMRLGDLCPVWGDERGRGGGKVGGGLRWWQAVSATCSSLSSQVGVSRGLYEGPGGRAGRHLLRPGHREEESSRPALPQTYHHTPTLGIGNPVFL